MLLRPPSHGAAPRGWGRPGGPGALHSPQQPPALHRRVPFRHTLWGGGQQVRTLLPLPPQRGAAPPSPTHHSLQPRRTVAPAATNWGALGCRQSHWAGGTHPPACSSSPCGDMEGDVWGDRPLPTPPLSLLPSPQRPSCPPNPGRALPYPFPTDTTPRPHYPQPPQMAPYHPTSPQVPPAAPQPPLACGQVQPGWQGGCWGQNWGCWRLAQSPAQGGPQGRNWKGGTQLDSAGWGDSGQGAAGDAQGWV